jgi:hypothetical protein
MHLVGCRRLQINSPNFTSTWSSSPPNLYQGNIILQFTNSRGSTRKKEEKRGSPNRTKLVCKYISQKRRYRIINPGHVYIYIAKWEEMQNLILEIKKFLFGDSDR